MALKNFFLNWSISALCVFTYSDHFGLIASKRDWLMTKLCPPQSRSNLTGGKIFLDRPPGKRKLWQNISRSPTKRWSSSANALPATSVWSWKCKMKLRWKSMKRFKNMLNVQPFLKLFGQVPQSEFQIPGSIVLRHWPVTRCLPECLCASLPPSLYSSKSGLPLLWRPADCT